MKITHAVINLTIMQRKHTLWKKSHSIFLQTWQIIIDRGCSTN